MEYVTIETLKTVAGAAFAVTLLTAIIKAVVPSVTGRVTQLVALALALIIAGVTGKWGTAPDVLVTFINGLVVAAAATGLDQGLNYKKNIM
jgi:hypothetical protein